MRGPFFVSLCACFETTVQAVARTRGAERNAPVGLEELRGSFVEAAERYFSAVLESALDTDAERFLRLRDLLAIRNALAHANGLREGMWERAWRKVRGAVERQRLDLDREREMIIPTQEYAQRAYEDVSGCLLSLLARARAERPIAR
jgi:hypothetical protein